jgi:Mg-chelatase subunit ChlD
MRGASRGVSDVVGYVLLIGVVTAGVTTILLLGGAAVDDLKGDAAAESSDVSLGQADRRLEGLSGTRVNTTRFQLRGASPSSIDVRGPAESGHVNVSLSGGACSARLPLSTIEYERDDGGVVAIQGGGRFAVAADGSSSVATSPPTLSARNGTVSVTTYNLSGFVDDREVTIRKNATASANASTRANEALLNGTACRRPTNMTITVHSAYYDGWADYLETETGVSATTDASAETASVYLPQSWLPRRANDSANRVINLSNGSMATVRSDGGPESAPSFTRISGSEEDNITINKGVNNTYSAVAVPLGNGTQSSYVELISGGSVSRRPVDVTFVIDESGSMGGDTGGDDPEVKALAARDAARNFAGQINESKDRVGFVGFDPNSRYLLTPEGRYLTNDSDVANTTVGTTEANGGTAMDRGLDKANALHDLRSRSGAQKVVILLSDGRNDVPPDYPYSDAEVDARTLDQAERAAANNVTIYTVGFGTESAIDDDLLTDVAEETGGEYRFAANASELNSVFQSILTDITSSQAIVHRPTTASLSVGGDTIRPQLGYSNPEVSQINGSYDINDPEYRGGFEFSARAGDGNLINVTATSYDCVDGAREVTDAAAFNNTTGTTYRRVRCTEVDPDSNETVEPDETRIYLDGADTANLTTTDEAWYQDDLVNDTLAEYVNGTELSLASNEAVVVLRYDTGTTTTRIVMLYQIGLSESDTTADVVDARVVNATVGDG